MYEKRHIVANLLMLIIAYLIDRLMNYLTFGSNLSQLVNNLSILLLVIPILMIIFSVVITLMFSSIIVSFLYYVTAIAYALIISNNVDFNLILSTFLNLLGYYALATIVIGAILGISRRSFPDEILLNISRLNVNISKNKIIYGGLFVVVSFLVFYEVLSNLFFSHFI